VWLHYWLYVDYKLYLDGALLDLFMIVCNLELLYTLLLWMIYSVYYSFDYYDSIVMV